MPRSLVFTIQLRFHEKDLTNEESTCRKSLANLQGRNWNLACALRRYGNIKNLPAGKFVHAHIINSPGKPDKLLGNLSMQMYGRCGAMLDARTVFDSMHQRNAFSWTIMIGIYAQHRQIRVAFLFFQQMPHPNLVSWNIMIGAFAQEKDEMAALQLFKQMQNQGMNPDKITFANLLSGCGSLVQGKQIHNIILKTKLEQDVVVNTSLINMYGKCNSLEDARDTFNRIPRRDTVAWNSVLCVYSHHGLFSEAMEIFRLMNSQGIAPDQVTLAVIFSACADVAGLAEGRKMHALVVRLGFQSDGTIGNATISMYGKCGALQDAATVFERVEQKNLRTWTTILAAYAQNDDGNEALKVFRAMQVRGIMLDAVTFSTILDVCADQQDLSQGKLIHSLIFIRNLISDSVVGNSLINMYGKCGHVLNAWEIFQILPMQDVISWTTMLSALARHGENVKAFLLFQDMQTRGLPPDKIAYIVVLDLCARLAALKAGRSLHLQISLVNLESDIVVANSLLNMYGKCGSLEDLRNLFAKMPEWTVTSWTSVIAAYAQHGCTAGSLQLFTKMHLRGVMPNDVTVVAVLSACNQGGLVDKGCHWFISVSQIYCIRLTEDHYSSIINLLTCSGMMAEALDLIDNMLFASTDMSWMTLIGTAEMLRPCNLNHIVLKSIIL